MIKQLDFISMHPQPHVVLSEKLNEVIRAQNFMEAANTSTNTASAQCKCVVKRTEVTGMGIIYSRRECPIHGHLHSARC
jgi:hypothetical protein